MIVNRKLNSAILKPKIKYLFVHLLKDKKFIH